MWEQYNFAVSYDSLIYIYADETIDLIRTLIGISQKTRIIAAFELRS